MSRNRSPGNRSCSSACKACCLASFDYFARPDCSATQERRPIDWPSPASSRSSACASSNACCCWSTPGPAPQLGRRPTRPRLPLASRFLLRICSCCPAVEVRCGAPSLLGHRAGDNIPERIALVFQGLVLARSPETAKSASYSSSDGGRNRD